MSKTKYNLLTVNVHQQFRDELDHSIKENLPSSAHIEEINYTPGSLLERLLNRNKDYYRIAYIDFSAIKNNVSLLEEVKYIKSAKDFKSLLLVGIIDGHEDDLSPKSLCTLGFSLVFVKGGELSRIISDSFYITFEEKTKIARFACCERIYLDLNMGLLSTITEVDEESFTIETDIFPTDTYIDCDFIFGDENTKTKLEWEEKDKSEPLVYPMLHKIALKYPYASAWEEMSENCITKEDIESWLDHHQDHYKTTNGHVYIFSRQQGILGPFFESAQKFDHATKLFLEMKNMDFNSLLNKERPFLIFLDLDDQNQHIAIEGLTTLVAKIKQLESYSPIIIISNNSSSKVALTKILNYQNILVSKKPLRFKEIEDILAYSDSKKQNRGIPQKIFKTDHPARCINRYISVKVTSLTEHEIIFNTKEDLPYFLTLEINLGISFLITIVPSYFKIENNEHGKAYMGVIHGISEEDIDLMRKLVNQMIYKPLSSFHPEEVKRALTHEEAKTEETGEEKSKTQAKVETKIVEREPFDQSVLEGKSKL